MTQTLRQVQVKLAPIPTVATWTRCKKEANRVQRGVGRRERWEMILPDGRVERAWFWSARSAPFRGGRAASWLKLVFTDELVFVLTALLSTG